MVALNTQERYSKIFLRYGQVPLGQNPDAEPSLEEIGTSVRAMLQSMFPHLEDLEAFGDLAFPRTTRSVIETLRVA